MTDRRCRWSDATIQKVSFLCDEGFTYSDVATIMTEEGRPMTRNTVAGIMHRLAKPYSYKRPIKDKPATETAAH